MSVDNWFLSLPLRVERHKFTESSRVLLELWLVSGHRAILVHKAPEGCKPLYGRVRNAFWRGDEDDELPRFLTPEHGFDYLVSLQQKVNTSTFLNAYFDRGVRYN